VRRSSLHMDEVEEVDGIPVTSVSRTLFDLVAVADGGELEKALNEAEVRRLTSRVSLPVLLERHPGRRGAATLRALLHDADGDKGVARSELEERFAALIDDYGLPKPRRNADVAVRGRFFKADCLWRRERVVVELDGRAVHGTAHAFEADRKRDRLLVGEGWKVIHLTWLQLRDEEPEIVADLRRALAQDLSVP
jgi:sulfur carrier protein ThiS